MSNLWTIKNPAYVLTWILFTAAGSETGYFHRLSSGRVITHVHEENDADASGLGTR